MRGERVEWLSNSKWQLPLGGEHISARRLCEVGMSDSRSERILGDFRKLHGRNVRLGFDQ